MSSSDSADEIHRAFVCWAVATAGVQLEGIDAFRFPQRGYGIKATRDITKGERLVFVPVKSMITVKSSLVKDFNLPKDCSVHGKLAAALTLSHKHEQYMLWKKTWPSQGDIRALPLMWADEESDCLPRTARDMLGKQREKIKNDREALRGALDGTILASDMYTYYWLVVNSRCFYWDYPVATKGRKPAKRRRKLPPDECMALCPFADYFNHADQGCDFDYDAAGCWISADRDYKKDEELYVSYGKHSNDFLLVEYGFILSENKWDVVKLDECILPMLKPPHRQVLREFGLLGDYTLDREGICYRTEAALRAVVMPERNWRNFLTGDYDGEAERCAVHRKLVGVAEKSIASAAQALADIEKLEQSSQNHILVERWRQVKNLLESAKMKAD